MATAENYFPEMTEMNGSEKVTFLMGRLKAVIEGSELIRRECNRIRNEFLGLGVGSDPDLSALLSHLQIDIVHLRVKFGYMTGLQGEELQGLLSLLQNPMSQLSNEDPA